MKKLCGKRLTAAILVGLSVSLAGIGYAAPLDNSTSVDVQVVVQQTTKSDGVIDWYKDVGSEIVVVGIGLPNPGRPAYALTRRAAIVDAQRNLVELINGVQVDSDTVMRDLMIESDVVHTKVSGVLNGAKIIEEGKNEDGSYYVKMTIPLFGANSVAAAALPEVTKDMTQETYPPVAETVLPQKEVKTLQNSSYSGVIIDASGMDLKPTFSPAVYDVNGRAIYGIKNIDPDLAISKGMAGYARSVQAAHSLARAGSNPLVVKAVETKGGANNVNKVNVVVSAEDGDRILLANQKSGMLDQCAIVLVQ